MTNIRARCPPRPIRRALSLSGVLLTAMAACRGAPGTSAPPAPTALSRSSTTPEGSDPTQQIRERMVREQIEARDIKDARVLAAMRKVPRHLFVPGWARGLSYDDSPAPIGYGQTISQPYIVALMTELAAVSPGARVLEVGTGSGYQAAILAEVGAKVYSIEIIEGLATSAAKILSELGYQSVSVRAGDGYRGWSDAAPFDAILVTAAPPRVPEPLKEQLRVGGRLVVPVGRGVQDLCVITRHEDGFTERTVIPVRFVPMTGEVEKAERK